MKLDVSILGKCRSQRGFGAGDCRTAIHGRIFWRGHEVVVERIPLFPDVHDGQYRRRFRCPCGRGAYILHLDGKQLVCGFCYGRHRAVTPLDRIALIRRKLDQPPEWWRPVTPRRSWRWKPWRRLLDQLARAEAALYTATGSSIAELDHDNGSDDRKSQRPRRANLPGKGGGHLAAKVGGAARPHRRGCQSDRQPQDGADR